MKKIAFLVFVLVLSAGLFAQPIVQFDLTSSSVGEGAGTWVISASIQNANLNATTVDVNVAGGATATSGVDFNYAPITITFPGGSTAVQNVVITLNDDNLIEGNEYFSLQVAFPTNGATIGANAQHTVTIIDNDTCVLATGMATASVSENIGVFNLPVTLTGINQNNISTTVHFDAANSTATLGADFMFNDTTITWPAGTNGTVNIPVPIINDLFSERNETARFQLLNAPADVYAADDSLLLTITANDTASIYTDISMIIRNENAGPYPIPVTRKYFDPADTTSITSTTLHFVAAEGTATPGSDFIFQDTTISWVGNATGTVYVPVNILPDGVYEPDERIKLQLINTTPNVTVFNDITLVIISANGVLPSGNCSDLYFSEYIDGSSNNKAIEIYNPTSAAFDLQNFSIVKAQNGTSLSKFNLRGTLLPHAVYVAANPLAAAPILAQADSLSSFFDFNGNDALYLLHVSDTIDVIGQSYLDPGANGWAVDTGSTYHHTLIRSAYHYHGNARWDSASLWWKAYPLNLFDSLGAHHSATCGAYVPFPELATIHFYTTSDTIIEDTILYKVPFEVINHSGYPVNFAMLKDTVSSTASEGYGRDYFFTGGTYQRDTGISHDTLVVRIFNDYLIEPTETIVIRVGDLGINAAAIPDSFFTLYIKDFDTLSATFYGAGFSYVEKDTDVLVRVLLSSVCPDSLVQVHVSLDAGSATRGVDFLFNDTIITFNQNTVDTQGVWVHIFDDNIPEVNEEINFNMTEIPSGILHGVVAYTLRIIDNDNPLGFSETEFDNNIKLFPNPVSNLLFLEISSAQNNVRINDLMGEEMLTAGKLIEGQNTIDVSTLAAGMYFVCINDSGKLMSKRFVKAE